MYKLKLSQHAGLSYNSP